MNIVLAVVASLCVASVGAAENTKVKVAFLADQSLGREARDVLHLVKKEGADMILHQGDFDYEDNPEAWDKMHTDILGENYPIFAALGNHDMKAWKGYVQKLEERLKRVPGASCTGQVGLQAVCSYRGLSMVFGALGLGTPYKDDEFFQKSLAGLQGPWKICSWHIPHHRMQVGSKFESVSWGPYEECRKAGAIVATGHEHSYSRTHLMDDFAAQKFVLTPAGPLEIYKGRTFAFVSGLGGHSVRRQWRHDDWWAAVYSKSQKAEPGALFCTFSGGGSENKASCAFIDIKGRRIDPFEVVSRP